MYQTVIDAQVRDVGRRCDPDGRAYRLVQVADPYEHPDYAAERQRVHEGIARLRADLARRPELGSDTVRTGDPESLRRYLAQPAREFFYRSATMRSWRTDLVPTAMALYNLQRPEEQALPNGVAVDDVARAFFRHAADSLGIRSRAQVMSELAIEHARTAGPARLRWASIACGAALPVFDAVAALARRPGAPLVALTLIDRDHEALDFARCVALTHPGQPGGSYRLIQADLLDTVVAGRPLERHRYHLIEALGIFEYFPDRMAARLARGLYQMLEPGGRLIVANMLRSHPDLLVNQRLIGWPGVRPRSIAQTVTILGRAGIAAETVAVTIPEDGVYAVYHMDSAR